MDAKVELILTSSFDLQDADGPEERSDDEGFEIDIFSYVNESDSEDYNQREK